MRSNVSNSDLRKQQNYNLQLDWIYYIDYIYIYNFDFLSTMSRCSNDRYSIMSNASLRDVLCQYTAKSVQSNAIIARRDGAVIYQRTFSSRR